MRSALCSAVLALCCSLPVSGVVLAQEITLRAANAFQEGTYYAKNFERFIELPSS